MITKEKVLVGLSGGVDSAYAAKLLLEQGYEVRAAFFSFCEGADPGRAAAVAEKLGIPLTVVNCRGRFVRTVEEPFAAAYLRGETPNPCVDCNREMKFKVLIETAKKQGIFFVATGHYAKIQRGETGRLCLCKAADEKKDQSYFLWRLTQNQLSHILFPLGDLEKHAVKDKAKDLVSEEQKESMEICFVPENDYQAFIESRTEDPSPALSPGPFVSQAGEVLGEHKGFMHYTVGQRRGLGVAMGERFFVTEIRPETKEVVLGPEEALLTEGLTVTKLNFVSCTKKNAEIKMQNAELLFKGRHRMSPVPCRVQFEGDRAHVFFEEKQKKIAPGQSVCFYEGEKLLFGGVVVKP